MKRTLIGASFRNILMDFTSVREFCLKAYSTPKRTPLTSSVKREGIEFMLRASRLFVCVDTLSCHRLEDSNGTVFGAIWE